MIKKQGNMYKKEKYMIKKNITEDLFVKQSHK